MRDITNKKQRRDHTSEPNQHSGKTRDKYNRESNIPNNSQQSKGTNLQPTLGEGSSEISMKGVLKEIVDSFRSKPVSSSSEGHVYGQSYRKQAGVPVITHHGSVKSIRHESVKLQDTPDGVLLTQNTGDDNMELDSQNPVPDGNKTTEEEEHSSSLHASEAQLQLMQEKAKEDRKVLDDLYETLDRERFASAETERKLQEKIESVTMELRRREDELAQNLRFYKQESSEQARKLKRASLQIDTVTSQSKEFETWISQLKTKNLALEQEKASFASQIEKMSQIVSQLNSKGLPLPPDDTYFTQELASLVSDIRAWSRGFTRGRPALTTEEMNAIEINLPDEIKGCLINSFHNFQDLLESKSVGTKLRTRCTEAILLRSLLNSYLHERYIGMSKEAYATIESIRSSLHASDQEIRYWSALTSHLYTKTNPLLEAQKEIEATQITEYLYTAISHFNDFPSRATKSTEATLKKIVLRVAKLGMEIAQLPFCVVPRHYPPGCRLRPENMEDIDLVDQDGDVDVNDEEKRTSIVLTPVWFKIVFDEEGREMNDKGQRILLCKASVSCLT